MTRPRPMVKKLIEWYGRHARALPWRTTTDPYAIWISEVMLQQTQVQTVIAYWLRWMAALPTVRALAEAPPERILKLWEGLGYYRRARNLQQAAQVIEVSHSGSFPRTHQAILALPGVGPYTAGAISSIAFDEPQPILDGNVIRVLTRSFGIKGQVRRSSVKARLWRLAGALVEEAQRQPANHCRPCATFNQSLMELGAVVCRPRDPACETCPLESACCARRNGNIESLPNLGARPATQQRECIAFVVAWRSRFLVQQRPATAVNGDFWEFPNIDVTNQDLSVEEAAARCCGFQPRALAKFCTIDHSITRYRIRLHAYWVEADDLMPNEGLHWRHRRDLEALPFTSAHRKVLQTLLKKGPS
ncbi:MAG: A/G-specific adenine glycosylase [Verrucomicrobiota bacterium]